MKKWQSYMGTALVGMSLSGFSFAETVPFTSDRWEFVSLEEDVPVEHEVVEYQGQESLSLRAGKAVLKDLEFTGGIIEFDMAFPAPKLPSFYGALWDVQSHDEYVVWYIRPHRGARDDDLSQAIPFYHSLGSWQLFWFGHLGKGPFNTVDWNHMKIILSGTSAEIYMNDMETPIMFVADSKRNGNTGISGSIGLKVYAESPEPAYYANFSYEPMDNPPMLNAPVIPQAPTGTVPEWLVSEPFSEAMVTDKRTVTEADRNAHTWTPLNTDHEGIANFARLAGNSADNTVFARTTIMSDSAQLKKFSFGYSEWARVFLNGQLMFAGDNEFGRVGNDFGAQRDYRFMGVVGYFDDLYLPLQAGANELWVAVTEKRAGWGVQGMLEDVAGIRFANNQTLDLDAGDTMAGCMASYTLDGNLHIPCVAVPNSTDPADGVTVFQLDMNQTSLFNYISIFRVDLDSIKLAE